MDPLDFLESHQLLQFFRRRKTEMSCMENPRTFLRQLRDHDLIPEDRYQKVSSMKNKEKTKDAIYHMLDEFEREQPQCIQDFWGCVFNKIIMDQYPTLQHLHKSLMDEFSGRVAKGETAKENGEQRSVTMSGNDEEQPGASSQLTPASPLEKGEKTDVSPLTNPQLPVTCRNLKGMLNKDKLAKGKKCISFNKRLFTPPEFEKHAGLKSKNWRSSIKCDGFTLKDCMEQWKLIPPIYRSNSKSAKKAQVPANGANSPKPS